MSMKKRVLATLMLSTVILASASQMPAANADTIDQQIQQNQQANQDAQNGAAQAKAQQDALQKTVDNLQTQIASATAEKTTLLDQYNTLTSQMATLNSKIADRKASLAAQARSAQTNGGATDYINLILNAKSLTDIIQKVSAMSTIVNANNQMLEQQQKDEKALSQKNDAVKKNYTQYMNLVASLNKQNDDLAVQQANLKTAQLGYQATIATTASAITALKNQKAAAEAAAAKLLQEQEAAAAQAQANQNAGSSGSGSGSAQAGGSYYEPSSPNFNPYAGGGCTDFVWQYFYARGITIGNIMPGNGGDWGTYGVSEGIMHTAAEAPGVIASFPAGVDGALAPYGHVAVVTAVHADGTFDVIEGNLDGPWGDTRTGLSPAGVNFVLPN